MKRTRVTDEQIIGILAEHEAGAKCADLCRSSSVRQTVRGTVCSAGRHVGRHFLQLESQVRRYDGIGVSSLMRHWFEHNDDAAEDPRG